MTTLPLNVSIMNDDVFEHNETFTLQIEIGKLNDVPLSHVNSAIVTIVDDDCKSLSYLCIT